MRVSFDRYLARRLGPGNGLEMLINVFARPFTATTLRGFWQSWNPGYGFFLLLYCYKPLRKFLPHSMSLLLTFLLCGFAHDVLYLVPLRLRDGTWSLPFVTCWFAVIAVGVVVAEHLGISFTGLPRPLRAVIHATFLIVTFLAALRL